MAVRNFNGTTDLLSCAIGGNTGFTFGTVAAIIKIDTSTNYRTLLGFHNSGGGDLTIIQISLDHQVLWWNGTNFNQAIILPTGVWVLVVVRKASGSANPRASVYNFNTAAWTHSNLSGTALANGTSPGASGTIRFSVGASNEPWDGRIAARAVWTNSLPWAATTGGDTAIIAANLHTSFGNWTANSPTSAWRFNQAAVTTTVQDVVGTAHESSRTGTTVVTGDDPPGFNFADTPSVVALGFDTLVFFPRALTPVPGVVTVALARPTLTLAAQPVTPVPQGPAEVALAPASLSLTGQAVDPEPGSVSVSLAPADLAFSALAVVPVPGAVEVPLSPANLSLTGQTLAAAPGLVTTTLEPSTLALTPQGLVGVPGLVTVDLDPSALAFSALAVVPVLGAVEVPLGSATLALSALALDPLAGDVVVDLTVVVGSSRVGTVTIGAGRVGTVTVSASRLAGTSIVAGASRTGSVSVSGSRGGSVQLEDSRSGSASVADGRVGSVAVGESREDRGNGS